MAIRLRDNGFRNRNISIAVRNVTHYTDISGKTYTGLDWHSCQRMLPSATNLASDNIREGMKLFHKRYDLLYPFRGLGVSCGTLMLDTVPLQINLFGDMEKKMRLVQLERSVDTLRLRYGNNIVQKGIVQIDRKAAMLDPKADHTTHPVVMYGMG